MIGLGLRASARDDTPPSEAIPDIILLLTAGLFLMSPNYAWYFLVLVPFIPLGAGAPAWALTLGAFLLYRPIFLPYNDLVWKTLATVPFLLTLVIVRASAAQQRRGGQINATEGSTPPPQQ